MRFWRSKKESESETNAAEARPSRRVRPPKDRPVEVQIMGANSLDILHARDLSPSGVGVYVPHGFDGCDIDEEVELVITLPRTRTFMAKGVIRHVTRRDEPEAYFGVQFTQISAQHRAQITAFMGELAELDD